MVTKPTDPPCIPTNNGVESRSGWTKIQETVKCPPQCRSGFIVWTHQTKMWDRSDIQSRRKLSSPLAQHLTPSWAIFRYLSLTFSEPKVWDFLPAEWQRFRDDPTIAEDFRKLPRKFQRIPKFWSFTLRLGTTEKEQSSRLFSVKIGEPGIKTWFKWTISFPNWFSFPSPHYLHPLPQHHLFARPFGFFS